MMNKQAIVEELKNNHMTDIDLTKYSNLHPLPGYVVIKDITKHERNEQIRWAGENESRAYAIVVAHYDKASDLLGKLIVYNEYEGQELFKLPGKVEEEDLIVLKEDNILLVIE